MKSKTTLFILIVFMMIAFISVQGQITFYGYSNEFTIGKQTNEPSNMYGYSAVFDMNTMGNYFSAYSDYFMLNTIGAQISGVVTDNETGAAIEGAVVKALMYSSLPTNQEGGFVLSVPFGYGYELSVIAENYHQATIKNVHVPQQNPVAAVNFSVYPADSYIDFRFAELLHAPNPGLLEVPMGGIGYAWFRVEGKVAEDVWFPVPNATIGVTDGQGVQVLNKNNVPITSNTFFYSYLNDPHTIEDDGVFCVPVKSAAIGNGQVAQQETFTITSVNGQAVSPGNQKEFTAELVPYAFSKNWGFRVYAKGGVGVGAATGIARANAFAGGGSGAGINVTFNDPDNTNDWSSFQVIRKNDFFAGVEASVGPPKLLNTQVGVSIGATASFPYQTVFDFEMDDLDGLEALLAFYIFYEPTIKLAGGAVPGGQLGVGFLSWTTEVLLSNSGQNGLSIVRESDACGMDIEGHLNLDADFGFNLSKNMKLGMDASAGVNAHFGSFIENHIDGLKQTNAYIGSAYNASLDVGLKLGDGARKESKFMYAVRMKQPYFPTNLEIEYACAHKEMNGNWQSLDLVTSTESNLGMLNTHGLPGQRQKYNNTFHVESEELKSWLDNNTKIPAETGKVGTTAVNMQANRNTFKNDVEKLLAKVYDDQIEGLPTTLAYSYTGEGKSEFAIDITRQFPLPIFPALDIVIGGGLEANNTREFELAEGYWVKGTPYFRTELPNPVNPDLSFVDVMVELWQNVIEGDLWGELADVIVAQILDSKIVKWICNWDVDTQTVTLNDFGSEIEIRENSIPTGIDSIFCRQWDWGEEPSGKLRDADHISSYKRYIAQLRDLREDAAGMHYGIGGFFRFEPAWETFGDSTLLTIAYQDTAITGLDENSLGMYWEDTLGIWHPIESMIEPDSNTVSAWINKFTTYTLAPRLPHGSYSLITEPDSIPSDGSSTALVYSPILLNNDSTQIEESTLFTIESSRGIILSEDIEPSIDGIQVAVESGIVQFEVRADSIATPIYLYANSVTGYAKCEGELILFDTIPPAPPTNLVLLNDNASVHIEWDEVYEPDIAGYRIYFDTDSPQPPYGGIATVYGEPSPVEVGKTDNHHVLGLFNDTTYYFAITAIDISGNESAYSLPVTGTPLDFANQKITLSEGWSGISSYVIPETDNMESIFNSITNELVILQNETGFYWPAQGTNTLGPWNTREGYQIKVSDEVELTISGTRENNKILQLAEGWNLIPVLSECEVNVAALFTGTDVVIVKEVAGSNIYWPQFGINTLNMVQPGKAYFALMGSEGEMSYPECTYKNMPLFLRTGLSVGNLTESLSLSEFGVTKTAFTHTIALPSGDFESGSFLAAYDQENGCCGITSLQGALNSITLFGDDPTTSEKDGFVDGEEIHYKIINSEDQTRTKLFVEYDKNLPQHDGSFHTNGLSAIEGIKGLSTETINDGLGVNIYPNPATDKLFIQLSKSQEITISVFTVHGQKMIEKNSADELTEISLKDYKPGVYLVTVLRNDGYISKGIIKQ